MENEQFTITQKELDDFYNQLILQRAECSKMVNEAIKENRMLTRYEIEMIDQFKCALFIYNSY